MVYLPIIGALLEASGMILEKKILRKRGMNFKNYTVYEFLAIVLVMLTFVYFFWRVDGEALLLKNIFIFVVVVVASVLANLLVFYSLKREDITEFEPIWMMQPFFTIFLAFLFFGSERKGGFVALALIASIALIASHIKKHHLNFNKYILAALAGSFLFSFELVISNFILEFYSGATFYFLRSLSIFLIVMSIFRPKGKEIDAKTGSMFLIVGLIWVLYRVIMYYGYSIYGIVFTTILFILSPVFLFLFAAIFLKEKPTLRNIISTVVIVICVVLAIVLF